MRLRLNAMDRVSILLILVMTALAIFPAATEPLLQFDRSAIRQGEWWRLLSGQLIHYGPYHTLMNVTALAVINTALWRPLTLLSWCATLLTSLLLVAAGLWYLSPDLMFYAGFSGALHGLLVAGLLASWRQTPVINLLALLMVAVKVSYEQTHWFNSEHALLPVPVASEAHLWGAVAGLICGLALLLRRRD